MKKYAVIRLDFNTEYFGSLEGEYAGGVFFLPLGYRILNEKVKSYRRYLTSMVNVGCPVKIGTGEKDFHIITKVKKSQAVSILTKISLS